MRCGTIEDTGAGVVTAPLSPRVVLVGADGVFPSTFGGALTAAAGAEAVASERAGVDSFDVCRSLFFVFLARAGGRTALAEVMVASAAGASSAAAVGFCQS